MDRQLTTIHRGLNNDPFHVHQNPDTMGNYLAPVLRLLAYLFRTTDELPESLVQKIAKYKAVEKSLSPTDSRAEAIRALHDILADTWSRHWYPTASNPFPDPTIRSVAYGQMNLDGTYALPGLTTGQYAKITNVMRYVFGLAIHRSGKSLTTACDDWCPWFTEGKESTFNSIQSAQHLATALTMSTPGLPSTVFLSDTVMMFRGSRIDFNDVRKMFAAQGEELVKQWEQHVSLGLYDTLTIPQPETVADDFTNKSNGYSYLSDPRNPYRHERTTLLRAVLADPYLRKRFTNGVDAVTGRPMWNTINARMYLKRVRDFDALLLMRCEMASGAPIRGTELASMRFQNTTTRSRNHYRLGNFPMLVGSYSKGSATTGDKGVGHGIDALGGNLLEKGLTFVRPFCNMLAAECFSGQEFQRVYELYNNYLFVDYDRPFTTDRISDMMKALTATHLKVPLPISKWRHVSIGFRQVLCRQALSDATSTSSTYRAAAEQAGHSQNIENRLYAVNEDAIDGTSGGDLSRFCEVSVAFQTVAQVVPSGIWLPYRECTGANFDQLVNSGLIKTPQDDRTKSEFAVAERVVALLKPLLSELIEKTQGTRCK